MDDRISSFITSLRKQLEGLPEQEIRKAIDYYEEYFNDAAEEGKDPDEILKELDPPEKIAAMIRMESSIIKAQRSPGLKNFTGVSRNAFKGVTTPLAVLILSIVVFFSFGMVAVLFAGAFSFFAGAAVIALGFAYEAFKIPSGFLMEIIGTIGFALFGAGICLLLAFALYRLGKLFIRFSTQLIRRILLQSGKPMPEMEKQAPGRKARFSGITVLCLTIIAVGLVSIGVSGMPMRYFTILNSMKPSNIVMRTSEYDSGSINKISVVTAHSIIRVTSGTSDKIVVSYGQPDWMDYDLAVNGSMLSFYEKSNGRLPLFSLLTLHESMTEVIISIPKGFNPDIITLESQGGHVYISGLSENISAETINGSIHVGMEGIKGNVNIKASTRNGDITMNGEKTGQKTAEGTEYYMNTDAAKTIELRSSNGGIYFD